MTGAVFCVLWDRTAAVRNDAAEEAQPRWRILSQDSSCGRLRLWSSSEKYGMIFGNTNISIGIAILRRVT